MPTIERPAPERPALAEAIDLDADRDIDSGLVETPEMPADDKAKPAPRRRTLRKPKADDPGVSDALAEKAAE